MPVWKWKRTPGCVVVSETRYSTWNPLKVTFFGKSKPHQDRRLSRPGTSFFKPPQDIPTPLVYKIGTVVIRAGGADAYIKQHVRADREDVSEA
jgi:hypothetical protein